MIGNNSVTVHLRFCLSNFRNSEGPDDLFYILSHKSQIYAFKEHSWHVLVSFYQCPKESPFICCPEHHPLLKSAFCLCSHTFLFFHILRFLSIVIPAPLPPMLVLWNLLIKLSDWKTPWETMFNRWAQIDDFHSTSPHLSIFYFWTRLKELWALALGQ